VEERPKKARKNRHEPRAVFNTWDSSDHRRALACMGGGSGDRVARPV